MAAIRAAVGEARFTAHWNTGQAMAVAEAIAYALTDPIQLMWRCFLLRRMGSGIEAVLTARYVDEEG